MKKILINAKNADEIRVALLVDNQLFDVHIEGTTANHKKANIYKGIVTRVEPSLEAAFVDYGQDRHGFLPLKEVHPHYLRQTGDSAPTLEPRQELIVQVEKEERGSKGASLTTHISLAGTFVVLMPFARANAEKICGISKSVDAGRRSEMAAVMNELKLPKEMRMILRTSGVGRTAAEIQWNLDFLVKLWDMIEQAAAARSVPFLIYRDGGVIERTIRDYLRQDVDEIFIDDDKIFQQITEFFNKVMPNSNTALKKYSSALPLFSHFDIEQQIESAFSRTVGLPSGGMIVIDTTEALVSIDVNSSRATKGADIEETALSTNLEAAEEISRQLRLRDLGGLMVVDFIDMATSTNRRKVEQHFSQLVSTDRARIKINRISRFGLLEMSRQRLGTSLIENNQSTCLHCGGLGVVRSIESLTTSIVHSLERAAATKGGIALHVQLPSDTATYLFNEKRHEIQRLESNHGISVVLIANESVRPPEYHVEVLRVGDRRLSRKKASYAHKQEMNKAAQQVIQEMARPVEKAEVAAIKNTSSEMLVPDSKEGWLTRFIGGILGTNKEKSQPQKKATGESTKKRHYRSGKAPQGRRRGRRKDRGSQN